VNAKTESKFDTKYQPASSFVFIMFSISSLSSKGASSKKRTNQFSSSATLEYVFFFDLIIGSLTLLIEFDCVKKSKRSVLKLTNKLLMPANAKTITEKPKIYGKACPELTVCSRPLFNTLLSYSNDELLSKLNEETLTKST
jgi:hypothetical protein